MGQDDNHWCALGFAEPAVAFKGPTQTARSVTEARMALHGLLSQLRRRPSAAAAEQRARRRLPL